MNPLALALIAIGSILVALGVFLTLRRSRRIGSVTTLIGVVLVALPFAISVILKLSV